MKRLCLLLCPLLLWIGLTACGRQATPSAGDVAMSAPAGAPMRADVAANAKMAGGAEQGLTESSEPVTSGIDPALRKYIAMRHYLTVETPAKSMQESFDAAIKHCEALNCQILSAYFNRETPYNPPSASLSVRVPPRSVEVFLNGLAKHAEITQHRRDAEDKTDQVVDAEARIKNLTELRDRLRMLLNDKTAKLKDVIEVERELANTQSQLDSITSLRKVLAQETDMVAVNIDFTAAQGITEQGFFSPVARALKDAGRVLMENFASLITLIVSAIPWLLVGIPVLLLGRKLWLKVKTRF